MFSSCINMPQAVPGKNRIKQASQHNAKLKSSAMFMHSYQLEEKIPNVSGQMHNSSFISSRHAKHDMQLEYIPQALQQHCISANTNIN